MTRRTNHLKTVVPPGAPSALVVGMGGALAPGRLPMFVSPAVATNVGAYFSSDRPVPRVHGARELAPDEEPDPHGTVHEPAAGRLAAQRRWSS